MFIININKYVADPCVGLCAVPLPGHPPKKTHTDTKHTHVIYMRIQIVIYFIYILQLTQLAH